MGSSPNEEIEAASKWRLTDKSTSSHGEKQMHQILA
jgi:hypothetical protein